MTVTTQHTSLIELNYSLPTLHQKRFISEDPAPIDITDPRTINRFTFVNNNPLRFVDPDGRFSLSIFRDTANFLLKPLHYSRNIFQEGKIPVDEQGLVNENSLKDNEWELRPEDETILHKQGNAINNIKYVDSQQKMEVVFDSQTKKIDTSDLNQGTYNFASPDSFKGIPHAALDVTPYILWGNTPNDPSTLSSRIKLSTIGLKNMLENHMRSM